MSEGYIGEIRLFAFGFEPVGWTRCEGQLLSVSENMALASLLRDRYGGDGHRMFALPDLRGRVAVSQGVTAFDSQNYTVGMTGGAESVTLGANTVPPHTHAMAATNAAADAATGAGAVFAAPGNGTSLYGAPAGTTTLAANVIGHAGGNQSHDNMQPFLAMSYCICTDGYYPPRA